MDMKQRNSRYSYKLKNRLGFKTRLKLSLRKVKLYISSWLYKLNKRGNKFFSFFHIVLILIILAVIAGLSLMASVIRANNLQKKGEEKDDFSKKNILIHYGNTDIDATVSGGILEEVIEDLDIEIDQDDEVFPDLSTPLKFVSECYIIIVDKKVVTRILQTDFEVIENVTEQENDQENDIERKVVRKGEKGEVLLKIELIYKNDMLFSQTTIEKEVLKKPVDEIVDIYKTNN